MIDDNKKMFKMGYCLEFALALQQQYKEQGVDVDLLGFFKEFNEDGYKYPEMAHAAVGLSVGKEYLIHDVVGIRSPQEVLDECLFLQLSKEKPRYEKMDLDFLESTLGSVVEEAVEEALNLIRKENLLMEGLNLIKNQTITIKNNKRLTP